MQVGKYIGTDAMMAQVKPDEVEDLKMYLRRYFLNTHGMSQEAEMQANVYVQEGAVLGYKYLTELRDGLYRFA